MITGGCLPPYDDAPAPLTDDGRLDRSFGGRHGPHQPHQRAGTHQRRYRGPVPAHRPGCRQGYVSVGRRGFGAAPTRRSVRFAATSKTHAAALKAVLLAPVRPCLVATTIRWWRPPPRRSAGLRTMFRRFRHPWFGDPRRGDRAHGRRVLCHRSSGPSPPTPTTPATVPPGSTESGRHCQRQPKERNMTAGEGGGRRSWRPTAGQAVPWVWGRPSNPGFRPDSKAHTAVR